VLGIPGLFSTLRLRQSTDVMTIHGSPGTLDVVLRMLAGLWGEGRAPIPLQLVRLSARRPSGGRLRRPVLLNPSLSAGRQRNSPSWPHVSRAHRRHRQRVVCQTKNLQPAIPSARSRPRSRRPPLQRSSSKLVALNTMRAVGRAPARTIPCETAGPVVGEALTLDLAGLRRFAIRAM
jgi:hypothetical protein